MNFFNAKLEKIDGKVYATFGENKILVPAEKLQKFVSDECIGKEVYLGIRPENINDAPEFVAKNPDSSIKVHVEVVELMGSETYLYLSTSGKEGNIGCPASTRAQEPHERRHHRRVRHQPPALLRQRYRDHAAHPLIRSEFRA